MDPVIFIIASLITVYLLNIFLDTYSLKILIKIILN